MQVYHCWQINLAKETSWASSLLDKTVEGSGLLLGAWASKCHFKVSFDIPITLAAQYTDAPCHNILLAFSMASAVYSSSLYPYLFLI